MIRIRIFMEDTDDNLMMDDSVVAVSHVPPSPTVIDVIDLTKESPSGSVRPSRSRQRNAEGVSSTHGATVSSDRRCRRPLSPIFLGNTQTKRPRKERRVPFATSSNEILTLDDTIKEDDKCYTIDSDNREAIPLKCPICFEQLTSNLKPITTRCGHVFCTECLDSFIRINKKCATCKAPVTLKSCTRLYL